MLLLHRRRAHASQRGLCLQDRALGVSAFQPGTPFRCWVDPAARQIILVPSVADGQRHTVSRRQRGDTVVPVIDATCGTLRWRQIVSNAAYLEIAIYPDRIVVTAFAAEAPAAVPGAASPPSPSSTGSKPARWPGLWPRDGRWNAPSAPTNSAGCGIPPSPTERHPLIRSGRGPGRWMISSPAPACSR